MAAPFAAAEPEIVQLIRFSVAWFTRIAPPFPDTEPPTMLRFCSVTTTPAPPPGLMWKTRSSATASMVMPVSGPV